MAVRFHQKRCHVWIDLVFSGFRGGFVHLWIGMATPRLVLCSGGPLHHDDPSLFTSVSRAPSHLFFSFCRSHSTIARYTSPFFFLLSFSVLPLPCSAFKSNNSHILHLGSPFMPSMLLLLLSSSVLISFHSFVACCQLSSHKIIDLLLGPDGYRPIRVRGDYLSFLRWLSPLSLGFVCPNNGASKGWNRNKLNKTCRQQNSKQLLQARLGRGMKVQWLVGCHFCAMIAAGVFSHCEDCTEKDLGSFGYQVDESLFYLFVNRIFSFKIIFCPIDWFISVWGDFQWRFEITNRHPLVVLLVSPKHSKISSFYINP